MAMTNSVALADRMKLLRSHGITKNFNDFERKDMGAWHYEQQELGYNYRMNDIEAALGISQMKRLANIVKTRNEQRALYIKKLENFNIKLLKVPSNTYSSVHLVVARLIKATELEHKEIFQKLRDSGIGVQLHYARYIYSHIIKKQVSRLAIQKCRRICKNCVKHPGVPRPDQ